MSVSTTATEPESAQPAHRWPPDVFGISDQIFHGVPADVFPPAVVVWKTSPRGRVHLTPHCSGPAAEKQQFLIDPATVTASVGCGRCVTKEPHAELTFTRDVADDLISCYRALHEGELYEEHAALVGIGGQLSGAPLLPLVTEHVATLIAAQWSLLRWTGDLRPQLAAELAGTGRRLEDAEQRLRALLPNPDRSDSACVLMIGRCGRRRTLLRVARFAAAADIRHVHVETGSDRMAVTMRLPANAPELKSPSVALTGFVAYKTAPARDSDTAQTLEVALRLCEEMTSPGRAGDWPASVAAARGILAAPGQ